MQGGNRKRMEILHESSRGRPVMPQLLKELRDVLYEHRYKALTITETEELIEKIDRVLAEEKRDATG